MNEQIKKQLNNCRVASIPPYNDTDTRIVIQKGSTMNVTPYQVHHFYIVELGAHIINPPQTSTLASNWNGGRIPTRKHYKCEISHVMGNMVKIIGCGYDPVTDTDYADVWEGWVPQDGIKILKELK